VTDDVAGSRQEARSRGLKYYFNNVPCRKGHLAARQSADSWCVVCADAGRERKRRKATMDDSKAERPRRSKESYATNPAVKARQQRANAKWKSCNSDRVRDAGSRNYRENRVAVLARTSAWSKNNRARKSASWQKYQARKSRAAPSWLTAQHWQSIDAFYAAAATLTDMLPDQYEVDHIVPLHGSNVCGLHVPWNLQILTRSENASKGNRFPSA
jgi:hypothetical protein